MFKDRSCIPNPREGRGERMRERGRERGKKGGRKGEREKEKRDVPYLIE